MHADRPLYRGVRCQVDDLQRNRRRAKLRGLLDGPLVALGLLLLLVLLRARRSTNFQLPTRLVSRRRFTCQSCQLLTRTGTGREGGQGNALRSSALPVFVSSRLLHRRSTVRTCSVRTRSLGLGARACLSHLLNAETLHRGTSMHTPALAPPPCPCGYVQY